MFKARWLAFAPIAFGLAPGLVGACSNGDDRPGSYVSAVAGRDGGSGGRAGGSSSDAGQTNGEAGAPEGGDGGASGEASASAAPVAIFPEQLQVDVGCGASSEPANLLIRNGGLLPLTISSVKATAGYVVESELPLQIAAMASATLQVTAPKQKATASVGDMSSGTLTFFTNEPGEPSHEVQLNTTLFGGLLEFSDRDGAPLSGALPLTYLSSDTCPDSVAYRVYNTGNLALTLFGPTFSSHLRGTDSGASGRNVARTNTSSSK